MKPFPCSTLDIFAECACSLFCKRLPQRKQNYDMPVLLIYLIFTVNLTNIKWDLQNICHVCPIQIRLAKGSSYLLLRDVSQTVLCDSFTGNALLCKHQ